MSRQRERITCELPFTYWVFGRPVSIQNAKGEKPSALGIWREHVRSALKSCINDATQERGFLIFAQSVEVSIIWLSTDPYDKSQPDLDNTLKPFLDVFNGEIIEDDRQVHRILAEKASVNAPPAVLNDVFDEISSRPEYLRRGEVTVVRLKSF